VPARQVPRPGLLRRLEGAREASTVALVAPGGYGKSRLLAEWAAHDRRGFVWLDLGVLPDEPDRLLAEIASGLACVRTSAAETGNGPAGVRRRVAARERAGPPDVFARAEELERVGLEAVLVLDGLEQLRSERSLQAIAAIVRGLPRSVTLALASRREIRAGLGRLRAEDRLLEFGARDLAMSAYEAGRLLSGLGVELDEQGLETLVDRTEGWPAGIHLSGASLRERPVRERRLRLSGADAATADYVREEILEPLDPARLRMLRRVSILEQLSGELCDAVMQAHGSGRELRELARDGAMLLEQNPAGSWFRAHNLVRDVLRSELALCEPELVPALHMRASEWFADRGLRQHALDHAAAARDASRTGALLLEEPTALLAPNRHDYWRWLNVFGPRQIASSPELSLAAALDAFSRGRAVTAGQLARASAGLVAGSDDAPLVGSICAVEAAAGQGSVDQLSERAERACSLLGAGSLRALARLTRGVYFHLRGERDGARAELQEAAAEAGVDAPVLQALALSQLALVDLDDAPQRAAESSARALEALRSARLVREPTAVLALAVSAFLKSHRGISDEAKGELLAATRMLPSLGSYMPWHEVEVRILMARASARLADTERARSLLAEASRCARRARPVPCLLRWIDEAWGEIDDAGATALTGPRSLTMAELRVLRFLPTHLSFREIGERLHVSANTVKSQAHAVYAKLGASSRSQAVAQASALGLIDAAVI